MKRLPRVTINKHKEKSLEAQETKVSSDRNTAKFARTQESFGEQEASLANLNAIEATCDVSLRRTAGRDTENC